MTGLFLFSVNRFPTYDEISYNIYLFTHEFCFKNIRKMFPDFSLNIFHFLRSKVSLQFSI